MPAWLAGVVGGSIATHGWSVAAPSRTRPPSTQPLLYLANTGTQTQGNPVASAPEPATIGLLGVGLVGLAYARRRKMI